MRRFAWKIVISLLLPVVASAAPFSAATATNEMGLDVFRQLSAERAQGNLVISPYSLEAALILAYAGADGTTRDEMAKALHVPNNASADTDIMTSFRVLRGELDAMATRTNKEAGRRNARSGAYTVENGKRVPLDPEPTNALEWHAANRLFAQQGYAFRDAFLTLMREGYDAPLEPLDFQRSPASARDTINAWVAGQTRERIQNLIPSALSPDTRLVLVNALYLKAPWNTPFYREATKPQPFHRSESETFDVPTMLRGGRLPYEHEDGLTVVALDYIGHDLQCLILLPDEGTSTRAAAAAFSAADFKRWAKLGEKGKSSLVTLYLPKFRTEAMSLALGRTLRTLGIKSAFDEPGHSANFDRIATRKTDDYLCLSEVFHQAFVGLDEEGTEAAAATAISVSLGASFDPTKPIDVRVDRPFFFAIQHRPSSAVLFLGRIVDPRSPPN